MIHAFSIETSCDETSVAIVRNDRKIISQITINQSNHKKFGGVVPEIASRAHLQILQKIIPESFKKAKLTINDIDFFLCNMWAGSNWWAISWFYNSKTYGNRNKQTILPNKSP